VVTRSTADGGTIMSSASVCQVARKRVDVDSFTLVYLESCASLSPQSGNFWIHSRITFHDGTKGRSSIRTLPEMCGRYHAPFAIIPEQTRYPLHRRPGGPQDRSLSLQKIYPPPPALVFKPANRPARSEPLYLHIIKTSIYKRKDVT
jgi:hypothetical protein